MDDERYDLSQDVLPADNLQVYTDYEISLEANKAKYEQIKAAEEAERQRLLREIEAVRREQYEVLCYSNACNVYNATAEGLENIAAGNKGRPESNDIMANPTKYSTLSTAKDSVFSVVRANPQIMITQNSESCCSYTAMNILNATCVQMGFGQGSVITADEKGKNPYVSNAYYCHQFLDNGNSQINGKAKNKTVPELIAAGELGAGSIVSYRSSHGSGSGYHAVTIASVERDKNGKVIGYTVQQNNGSHETKMEHFTLKKDGNGKVVSEPENPFKGASKDGKDYVATPVDKIIGREIEREIVDLSKLSPMELEQILKQRKNELQQQKTKMKQNEKTMLSNPKVTNWNKRQGGAAMTICTGQMFTPPRYMVTPTPKKATPPKQQTTPSKKSTMERMKEDKEKATKYITRKIESAGKYVTDGFNRFTRFISGRGSGR